VLIDRKLLDPCKADDPAALNAVAARALALFCAGDGSRHEQRGYDKIRIELALACAR
jgi:hypothetical protein